MQITLLHNEGGVTIRVDERRLDAAIATAFKDRVRSLVAHGGGVVTLDMAPVEFLDSSGLGAIIAIFKSLPATRRLELVNLTPNVDRVFRLTRMDKVMSIRPATALPDQQEAAE